MGIRNQMSEILKLSNLSKGIAVNEPQIAKTPQDVVALLIEKRKEFNDPKEFIVSFDGCLKISKTILVLYHF